MRTAIQIRADLEEAQRVRDERLADVANLNLRLERAPADAGLLERLDRMNSAVANADGDVNRLEAELGRTLADQASRREALQAHARGETASTGGTLTVTRTESGDGPAGGQPTRVNLDSSPAGLARTEALRALDQHGRDLSALALDRLHSVIARDRTGVDAEYFRAISNPAYLRAFGMMLARPDQFREIARDDELAAMRAVTQAVHARAMSIGGSGGADGGYGVPLTLDPSIAITSDGALSPIRRLARNVSITTSEWAGVSSQGVSAHWYTESEEVSDDAPTLAQPRIKAERASAFVEASMEVVADYVGLGQELARLFADAKNTLEATAFLTGTGTDEPEGILTGLTGGSIVLSASASTLDPDDVYTVQADLGARFQPRAQWGTSLGIANQIHRFASPSGDEPPLFNADRSLLLAKPWNEISDMSPDDDAGETVAIYADWQASYAVVDRLGMAVELVPHTFGSSRRPSGNRGFFCWWRVGGGVIAANAGRTLKIKPS